MESGHWFIWALVLSGLAGVFLAALMGMAARESERAGEDPGTEMPSAIFDGDTITRPLGHP